MVTEQVEVEMAIDQWVELVRAEYREIPGLHLTKPQIQRLWGMDADTCNVLVDKLQAIHFLRRTQRDGYVRADR